MYQVISRFLCLAIFVVTLCLILFHSKFSDLVWVSPYSNISVWCTFSWQSRIEFGLSYSLHAILLSFLETRPCGNLSNFLGIWKIAREEARPIPKKICGKKKSDSQKIFARYTIREERPFFSPRQKIMICVHLRGIKAFLLHSDMLSERRRWYLHFLKSISVPQNLIWKCEWNYWIS